MQVEAGSFDQLLQAYTAQPEGFMWFLGAGASRTANMPTASDLIWELKLRQYCREENQDIQLHDVANRQVRERVQSYFDSKGAPQPFDPNEYSFFFEQAFGADLGAQQQFLSIELDSAKISLNVGQRVLAAMMVMGAARVIFTTNFDEVIETAFAEVARKPLMAFSLDGSYAVIDALNKEAFPLYAKLHGDFRFRHLKNLPDHLRENDETIARAFLTCANRFGAVISGYSGRDDNVLRMFKEALNLPNPFHSGLFWTVARITDVSESVLNLISAARAKGIKASVVEVGTFDILMNKLWRQLPNRQPDLVKEVRPDHAGKVAITLPPRGHSYPMLRTNALPIVDLPNSCGRFVCSPEMTYAQLREAQGDTIPDAAIAITDALLFWGSSKEVQTFIAPKDIKASDSFRFDDPRAAIIESTILKGFFEHGLAKALCASGPINLRYRHGTYYAVSNPRAQNAILLEPLAAATGGHRSAPLSGVVPKADVRWVEAVSIRLEERNARVYLMLEPTIWITPSSQRDLAGDFIRARVLKRYNPQANRIFDAWIGILLGEPKPGENKVVTAFAADDHPVSFTVNSRSAFSRREQRHVE